MGVWFLEHVPHEMERTAVEKHMSEKKTFYGVGLRIACILSS